MLEMMALAGNAAQARTGHSMNADIWKIASLLVGFVTNYLTNRVAASSNDLLLRFLLLFLSSIC